MDQHGTDVLQWAANAKVGDAYPQGFSLDQLVGVLARRVLLLEAEIAALSDKAGDVDPGDE